MYGAEGLILREPGSERPFSDVPRIRKPPAPFWRVSGRFLFRMGGSYREDSPGMKTVFFTFRKACPALVFSMGVTFLKIPGDKILNWLKKREITFKENRSLAAKIYARYINPVYLENPLHLQCINFLESAGVCFFIVREQQDSGFVYKR